MEQLHVFRDLTGLVLFCILCAVNDLHHSPPVMWRCEFGEIAEEYTLAVNIPSDYVVNVLKQIPCTSILTSTCKLILKLGRTVKPRLCAVRCTGPFLGTGA